MASPYSLPDRSHRPLTERKETSHSYQTEVKVEIPERAFSFTLNDEQPAITKKKMNRDRSDLRRVISNLGHSPKEVQREGSHPSETAQEHRYRMRIKSSPSNEAEERKQEEDEDTNRIKTSQRVSAGSKVNYIFLNEAEQVERYKNIREEYLTLKKELALKEKDYYATYSKTQGPSQRRKGLTKADSMILEAHDKLKGQKFEEQPQCENVLQNLAECLASGALKGDSVELGLICSLVRKVKMGISSQEGLSLMTRANSFLKNASREEIASFITSSEPARVVEKPKPLYSYVPFPFHTVAASKIPSTLRAQTTGSKVQIAQSSMTEQAPGLKKQIR